MSRVSGWRREGQAGSADIASQPRRQLELPLDPQVGTPLVGARGNMSSARRPPRRPPRATDVHSDTDAPKRRLLEEVARGGVSFGEVILTRNRRVMVSVGERGKVLRLHQAFAEAPAKVLRAVGGLLAPRRRGRAAARRVIADFIRSIPAAPRAGRRRHIPLEDRPHLELLQAEFDRVNAEYFAGGLPRVPLYLSGRMRRRNGHFSADPLEIVISRRLCHHAEDGEASSTLRHEMIHLWQHHNGRRPDHGGEFRQWARVLDVHPRATREVGWKGKG